MTQPNDDGKDLPLKATQLASSLKQGSHRSERELLHALFEGRSEVLLNFILNTLSSIPWLGGAISGLADVRSGASQDKVNLLVSASIERMREELIRIGNLLGEACMEIDATKEEVRSRLSEPAYLAIVQKCFRDQWTCKTEQKRVLVRNIIVNAANFRSTSDDIVIMFVDWIDKLTEIHFAIIRILHDKSEATPALIWDHLYEERVTDDAAEVDLFAKVMRDLSFDGIIHINKEARGDYRAYADRYRPRSNQFTQLVSSRVDNEKPRVLTSLGSTFARYVMRLPVPTLPSS